MRDISSNSCIKFVNGSSPNSHYIQITNDRPVCESAIGYLQQEGQVLSVGPGCKIKGKIIHELLHSLGFIHQHSSPNSGAFIDIATENIIDGQGYNFITSTDAEVTDFGLAYDYESILHYGPLAFSKNGRPTITATMHGGENIGQRVKLSDIDIEKINYLYQCPINGHYMWPAGRVYYNYSESICKLLGNHYVSQFSNQTNIVYS